MSKDFKCPQCGAPLPEKAPAGLCPNCLMALNLKTETIFSDDTPTAQPPLPPEQIAPHFPQLEILECLGRGGMGVVYKARQKTLNRFVALKLLAPERVGDPKFAERFTREAQALAALNHPNIVTIHDFGQAGGFYFLLMEFVDGANLRHLLRAQKFTPEEALAIVPPLCEALQYAHERGIVHRDIKPENLLLDKTGRVKIADFGIAKMLGTNNGGETGELPAGGAATQNVVGTRGYSAPEQQNPPQRVDNRADIYSLGVVLYEMLTGELPGKTIEPPSRKVHIDVRLDAVVLRALEKTPELRWQTAGEMRTQVETIAAEGGTTADQPVSATVNPGVKINPVDAAILRTLESWLAFFDKGDYGGSWEAAAKFFKNRVTKAEWIERGNITRQPLGRVISRSVRKVRRFAKWFVVKYDTEFAGMKAAVETVTFSREHDGEWRAIGYLILPAYAEADRSRKLAWEAVISSGLATLGSVATVFRWPHPTAFMMWAIPVLALAGIIYGLRAKEYPLGKIGVWMGIGNLVIWAMLLGLLFFTVVPQAGTRAATSQAGYQADLVDSPLQLQKATTAEVIQAGLSKPLSPWAWQELERRQLTTNETAQIMDGVTAWLQHEYPAGDPKPLSWLDQFLDHLAKGGRVTDDQKIRFLTVLNGELRGNPEFRIRQGEKRLNVDMDWRYLWRDDLLGMVMMNEVQSATVDGQPLKPVRNDANSWNFKSSNEQFELPALAPGKHRFKTEVLSALVAKDDLTGISQMARSVDWPPEKKRWVRTAERELTIYAADEPIVGETDDPALNPLQNGGLAVKQALIRSMDGRTHAVLTFYVKDNLPVDVSFDVALRVGGQTIPCGQLWATKDSEGQFGTGNTELTADLAPLRPEITNADVVLTPNPKTMESNPAVDRIWGKEIVLSKVALGRLDITP